MKSRSKIISMGQQNYSHKQKPSLVLSGGGIKAAAFHIGVCLALREKGFRFAGGSKVHVQDQYSEDALTFKNYVGSSAGSVICTFLAAGYSIESIVEAFALGAAGLTDVSRRRNKNQREPNIKLKPLNYKDIFGLNIDASLATRLMPNFFKKKPLISGGFEVLLKQGFKVNGLFNMKNLERYMRENVLDDNHFKSLGVNLNIVATQLNHSRKVVFGPFDQTTKTKDIKYASYATISEAVAASASLPPAFAPYGIKNEKNKTIFFFDGEIRDTLSTHVASDAGSDLVISSYSIQPYHFNKEIGSLHEYGIPAIFNQALYQLVQQKIDKHIDHQKRINSLINTVNGYLKEIQLPQDQREKLMDILIERTQHQKDVDYIYIHPSPQDYKMFFYDHFSLNPVVLEQIVRTGFKAAMTTLRKIKFQ
ncbi:MAG: patatin-like phospholipase family protein [Bdellovibrionales bacterium]|nr:patatin-like phospholipase family protein [Bdellovibrionales bacterium]